MHKDDDYKEEEQIAALFSEPIDWEEATWL